MDYKHVQWCIQVTYSWDIWDNFQSKVNSCMNDKGYTEILTFTGHCLFIT